MVLKRRGEHAEDTHVDGKKVEVTKGNDIRCVHRFIYSCKYRSVSLIQQLAASGCRVIRPSTMRAPAPAIGFLLDHVLHR